MKIVRGLPPSLVRGLFTAGILILLGAGVSGCVVAPGRGGGWCYWHPHRCW